MTVLPDDGLSLAAEFPDANLDQWHSLVAGVLRKSGKEVSGAAAEDALSTALEDGLRTRPCTRRTTPRPTPASPASRPSCAAPAPRGAPPAAGTCGSGTRSPTTARSSRTWRTVSPRCGWSRARAVSRSGRSARSSTVSSSTSRRSSSTRRTIPVRRTGVAAAVRRARHRRQGRARQPRRRPAGPRGPYRRGVGLRARRPARAAVHRGVPGAAGTDRGRAAVPRGRRFGRAGAGRLDRHRCRLPAGAHRGRAERRTGLRAAGVPVRGDGRPVPDDRQAAGRAPAVGAGRRGAGRPQPVRRHSTPWCRR